MDVNGTRFELLLGRDDWAACTDESGVPLDALWGGGDASPLHDAGAQVTWDADRHELTLLPEVFEFPAGRLARPPRLSDRRGAGGDVYGNFYWIGPDARTILVQSVGDGSVTQFWPGRGDCPPDPTRLGLFAPLHRPAPARGQRFAGAAVTEDHFLVVGTVEPPGLLVFDLLSGGPPSELPWPGDVDFLPFDIAARSGGGVFVLDLGDVANPRVWELDRNFHVVPAQAPPAPPAGAFAPVEGEPAAPEPPLAAVEALAVGGDPVAVVGAPDGGFLLLDRNEAGGHSLLSLYVDGVQRGVEVPVADTATGLEVIGYDMVLAGDTLYVVDAGGNQSYAFRLQLGDAGPSLKLRSEYYPMRLYSGKGLIAATGKPWYDFGDGWSPLVRQPRSRYVESATIVTPAFDSGEPGCLWHRLMIDACLPPGTALEIWSVASDDEDTLDLGEWRREPDPLRRRGGAEVPFVALGPYDTHELLFQRAHGRHLRIKLTLIGDGRASPRIRALRAWHPRFSYLAHYLPGVYREDPSSSSFLDRFLANVEGLSTAIEDRIAAAQVLLRPKTAPAEALDWLASWFELALDPLWDERRRRLFLTNAMRFLGARGTIRGVEIALRFVLDRCVDAKVYEQTHPPALATARIVEAYRTRKTPGVVFGDPTDLAPLRPVRGEPRWDPTKGRDALNAGYAAYLKTKGLAPRDYPVADPKDETSAAWREFSQAVLGFVPELPDRARWQAFLSRRHAGAAPSEPPAALPSDGATLLDWFQFQSVVLAMVRKAHRFTVLLPWPLHVVDGAGNELDHVQLRELARRIVDLQKPAHAVFDVRFFWAAFRVGEARLGDDTLLASGSRVPELVEPAVLGRDYVGTSYLAGPVASDEIRRTPPRPTDDEETR
jgi:phage tail-like protein